MTDPDRESGALDALFRAAREETRPGDDFMARIVADATAAAEANAEKPAQERASPPRQPFWQRWVPVSGLTAATLAGLWIGMVLPETDFGTTYLADLGAQSALGDSERRHEVSQR
ncbi:MAG: hypothetical protein AAF762_11580, partial [Pseudomonadota bacterium]